MTLSPDERRKLASVMLDLSQEITEQADRSQVDPGRLMRLMAMGIAQCLIVQAAQISDAPPSGDL